MYSIFLDDICIYDDTSVLSQFVLLNPRWIRQDNTAGSLTFTIAPSNPGYDILQPFENEIEIRKNGVPVWYGRPITTNINFAKLKSVTCEGCLGYLNDTIQPQHQYNSTSIQSFLNHIINNHNAQSTRKFALRNVIGDGSNHNFTTDYTKTWEAISNELIEDIGGHILVEKVNNIYYIDYYYDYPNTSSQIIRFGTNLLDFTQDLDRTSICTVLIPLGASINYDEETGFENRVNIKSVNGGKEYLEATDAIAEYGRIVKVMTWDYVEDPTQLKQIGERYLSVLQFEPVQLNINAVDMTMFGVDTEEFKMLDKVLVISDPHGLNKYFPITKIDMPLYDLSSTSYTMGAFSDVSLSQNNQAVQNYIYSVSKEYNKKISDTYVVAKETANSTIVSDTLYYLATPLSEDVTINTPGWTTTPQSITETNKYLWTYHTYLYGDEHTSDTSPVITGVYGEDGSPGSQGPKGDDGISIVSVTPLWYCSNSSTAPSAPSSEVTTTSTNTGIWTKGVPALSSSYKYLYTCDQVKYSDGHFTWTTPVLHNTLTSVYSEIIQLADSLVLKINDNNQLTVVALGKAAGEGTDIRLQGKNIRLDGDVTITSGFKLNAGVIQSQNYVAGTSGTKINLTDGLIDSTNVTITGNLTFKDSLSIFDTRYGTKVQNIIKLDVTQTDGHGSPTTWTYNFYGVDGLKLITTGFRQTNTFYGDITGRAASAANATNATKITVTSENPTYSTPSQWGNFSGDGVKLCWFNTLNKIANQPSQWGFLLHLGLAYGEGHQIWAAQPNSNLLHRGFNTSSNLSDIPFKTILDSSNYSSYALPKSGGNLTGWLTFNTNLGIRINNQSQVTNLGTSSVVLCGNSGGFVRRYDNNNTATVMHASQFAIDSSRLIKENIKNITDDYARNILKLRPVSFDYIEKVGGQKGQCGMIAEEVLPIYPECVNVPDEYTEEKAIDEIENGSNMMCLSLDYAKFTPYLIKMVQIQQKEIDELKSLIAKLS